ncbi:MAG TPA: immunoglobulin domain-containing protein [Candidatus Acidoferrum sp.]|nr:immunoglobulin domain-containing protein [Candidatus Acidoferrum sp.]
MKTRFLIPLKKLAGTVAVPALAILAIPMGRAAPFTTGNIAVLQEGDGTTALSTASSPIAILEYTTGGGLVQTISIPTTGTTRLTQSSGSASEGFLARSVNTSNLTFVGYDAGVGTNNIPGTAASANNRYAGQVDYNGNFTRTAGSSAAFSGSNIRSSTSDGTNYWMSGTGSPASGGGIWYSANGAAPVQISGGNLRVTRIFNGTLYGTTASGQVGLFAFAGLPTSSAGTNSVFITGGSPYDFAVNSAGNLAYVCDDSALTSGGGIEKWTFSGGTWSKKLTFGSANGLTAGCRGLAVDFSGANPVLFATTADAATKVIKITDTSAFTATSDTTDQAATIATAGNNYAFRGVALAPVNPSAGPPVISGIAPLSITNGSGSSVQFLVSASGSSPFTYYWYKEIPGSSTNLIPGATTAALVFPSAAVTDSANYQVIISNAYSPPLATSAVVSLTITSAPPTISGITPASIATNAGQSVSFTVTAGGSPPLGYQWYKETDSATNLIAGATTSTLTLPQVLAADAASYQAVVTNASPMGATSAVVSLTVTDDPHIAAQPADAYGLLEGTAQFAVSVIGTAPISYQWYFADGSGNPVAPVTDGNSTASGVAVVSGSMSSTLGIVNLQLSDPTNFLVVISNAYGIQTSLPASLLSVSNTAVLAFWDFNGPEFTNYLINPNCVYDPVPYIGVGTAQAVGSCVNPGNIFTTASSPFSGSVDPNDGNGFTTHLPPFSWGTDNYPASGGNKQNGVQFNVSTVGAKNIRIAYESRVSATASDYERLEYTTNGTTWLDFPASSSFGGVGTTYLPFSYDLSGFPGVANNPEFGFRVVTEFQSTATYGVSANAGYLGTANTYGTAGTVTYDLVTVTGDAITNNNLPPTISSFSDTNTPDYIPLTLNFTVGDDTTPPDQLTYSATSLNAGTVNPSFAFGGSGPNRTLTIVPNTIPDEIDAAPILVRVTDTNGDSTVTSFLLTVTSVNLAPTNTLTQVKATNTLANTALSIPFAVGDDRTAASGLTYTVASGNTTLVPSGNIVVHSAGTANPSVTITPAANQLGVGVVSVTVNDNDAQEPRSTTATIAFMVRPNTNVVAIDYFDYDGNGALDTLSGGFWQHLSGVYGQMKVGSGVVTVDTRNNTENLQTPLLGGPYKTNSGAVLYASYLISVSDPTALPNNNGTFFTTFNDGSGITGFYECLVVIATNGAAPGSYRLGIVNSTNDSTGAITATSAQMFPRDLVPGSNYVVVTSLALSNGFSTLWVDPNSPASLSVADTIPALPLNNIADFELRESGANGGIISLSELKVGTSFDSVLPALHIQPELPNVIVNWSDPTLGIQSATNVTGPYADVPQATPPYTNSASSGGALFFRFKR